MEEECDGKRTAGMQQWISWAAGGRVCRGCVALVVVRASR